MPPPLEKNRCIVTNSGALWRMQVMPRCLRQTDGQKDGHGHSSPLKALITWEGPYYTSAFQSVDSDFFISTINSKNLIDNGY